MKTLPLKDLRESPENTRKHFGDLKDLAASIKAQGILQEIAVRKVDEGFEIVFGHRRARAARLAGLKEVPVKVVDMSAQEALEARIVENEQREDVSALEKANGYLMLMKSYAMPVDAVAERVGIARSQVYDYCKLMDLAEPVKRALNAGRISTSNAIELARVKGERLQVSALTQVEKLSKGGEPPNAKAVKKLISEKFLKEGHGTFKKRSAASVKAEVAATRKKVLGRLLAKVVESVERRRDLDDRDLRAMTMALETPAVLERREMTANGIAKLNGAQLRGLAVEMAVAKWATLDGEEYSKEAKVLAKLYGVSLAELEETQRRFEEAEALMGQ